MVQSMSQFITNLQFISAPSFKVPIINLSVNLGADCSSNADCGYDKIGAAMNSHFRCKKGCEPLPMIGLYRTWDADDWCCYYYNSLHD